MHFTHPSYMQNVFMHCGVRDDSERLKFCQRIYWEWEKLDSKVIGKQPGEFLSLVKGKNENQIGLSMTYLPWLFAFFTKFQIQIIKTLPLLWKPERRAFIWTASLCQGDTT